MSSSMFIIVYVVLLLLLFLPIFLSNRSKKKKFNNMLNQLKVGDKILTIGGIYGVVSKINENDIQIQIAKGVSMTIIKGAIAKVVE